jgi:hypothetical protein
MGEVGYTFLCASHTYYQFQRTIQYDKNLGG